MTTEEKLDFAIRALENIARHPIRIKSAFAQVNEGVAEARWAFYALTLREAVEDEVTSVLTRYGLWHNPRLKTGEAWMTTEQRMKAVKAEFKEEPIKNESIKKSNGCVHSTYTEPVDCSCG